MPEGSSSLAPVTNPGPIKRPNFLHFFFKELEVLGEIGWLIFCELYSALWQFTYLFFVLNGVWISTYQEVSIFIGVCGCMIALYNYLGWLQYAYFHVYFIDYLPEIWRWKTIIRIDWLSKVFIRICSGGWDIVTRVARVRTGICNIYNYMLSDLTWRH